MAFKINPNASFIISDVDFTDYIQYSIITDTYILGAIFVFFGSFFGFIADCLLWCFYGIVLACIKVKNKKCTKKSQNKEKDSLN